MATLWIDCKYGISGDMLLSALVDLGADKHYIEEQLNSLQIDPFEMSFRKKNVQGIQANHLTLVFKDGESQDKGLLGLNEKNQHHLPSNHELSEHPDHHHVLDYHLRDGESRLHHKHTHEDPDHHHEVTNHLNSDHGHLVHKQNHSHEGHDHHHRHAKDIFQLISNSTLAQRVKERSLSIFREIARAEGKIHGLPLEEVHFHEVGAMDSIVDIIGVCLALESLDIDYIMATSVPTGSGVTLMAHGLYPIPAPATAEILVGVPLSDFTSEGELTTPTGAAYLKVLVSEFTQHPTGTIEKIGYGSGNKSFKHPNILRAFLLKK